MDFLPSTSLVCAKHEFASVKLTSRTKAFMLVFAHKISHQNKSRLNEPSG